MVMMCAWCPSHGVDGGVLDIGVPDPGSRGFQVVLVNARLVRLASGRKSDVVDCQRLRHRAFGGTAAWFLSTARRGLWATHATSPSARSVSHVAQTPVE